MEKKLGKVTITEHSPQKAPDKGTMTKKLNHKTSFYRYQNEQRDTVTEIPPWNCM